MLNSMGADCVQVRPYEPPDADAWEAFVRERPSATVFHRLVWSQAVHGAYGHEPHHLTAWSGAKLVGVLPLFLVKSVFVGRVLVSIPYATYGGIAADTAEAAEALLAAGRGLCQALDVQYMELRHRDANAFDLPLIDRYDTFHKELPGRAEDVLASLPRKTRAAARKGLGSLAAEFGPDLLDSAYDLYSVTLRRLGSPNYSRRLFHELARRYGDDCVCLLVRDGGRAVAGVVSFVFRDEIVPYFSGSLPEGMAAHANNAMYVWLMEYAVGRGLRWFDFNRSRRDNRGPHAFKRNHGFEPSPLHYQILLHKAGRPPNLTPGNRKFAVAGRVWRRLPLCVTRTAGAKISKWIP